MERVTGRINKHYIGKLKKPYGILLSTVFSSHVLLVSNAYSAPQGGTVVGGAGMIMF